MNSKWLSLSVKAAAVPNVLKAGAIAVNQFGIRIWIAAKNAMQAEVMNADTYLQITKHIQSALYRFDIDWESKQDIIQETIFKIWQMPPGEITNVGGLARMIARNAAIDYLRRLKRAQELFPPEINFYNNLELKEYTADPAVCSVEKRELRSAVSTLTNEHKLVLGLYYCTGLKYDEIAAQLQIPVGTVRSRLAYARKYLQEALGAAA
jgi:RNA polymerase sigma-70 factor (ECF subfamily)